MATTKAADEQIQAVGRMNLATLRRFYKETFGKETASKNRDALRRTLVSHLREKAENGGTARGERDARLPPAGTILARRHLSKIHKVTVLEDGFVYAGRNYGSLSTIARDITGTVWNGFIFFGKALKGGAVVIDFYRTNGGRRFIDHTVPDLVLQLQRVANALDRLIDLAESAKKAHGPAKEET